MIRTISSLILIDSKREWNSFQGAKWSGSSGDSVSHSTSYHLGSADLSVSFACSRTFSRLAFFWKPLSEGPPERLYVWSFQKDTLRDILSVWHESSQFIMFSHTPVVCSCVSSKLQDRGLYSPGCIHEHWHLITLFHNLSHCTSCDVIMYPHVIMY